MMSDLGYILIGLFLPLFPLSILFNAVLARVARPALRGTLLLAWPQAGLLLVSFTGTEVPGWLTVWALATAAHPGLVATGVGR